MNHGTILSRESADSTIWPRSNGSASSRTGPAMTEEPGGGGQRSCSVAPGGLASSRPTRWSRTSSAPTRCRLGIATNFVVNGRDVLVPMVIEEPSVVAGASFAARLARAGGGFHTETTEPLMIGQMQVLDVPDLAERLREGRGRQAAPARPGQQHRPGRGQPARRRARRRGAGDSGQPGRAHARRAPDLRLPRCHGRQHGQHGVRGARAARGRNDRRPRQPAHPVQPGRPAPGPRPLRRAGQGAGDGRHERGAGRPAHRRGVCPGRGGPVSGRDAQQGHHERRRLRSCWLPGNDWRAIEAGRPRLRRPRRAVPVLSTWSYIAGRRGRRRGRAC